MSFYARHQSNDQVAPLLRSLSIFLVTIFGLAITMATVGTAVASTTLCSGANYSTCTNSGYTDHGYGSHISNSYWRADKGHNCTNYVAYVEGAINGAPTPSYNLGNAADWGVNAQKHGVLVDSAPGKGSVAWWNKADGDSNHMGQLGHVAYVEDMSGSPGSYTITISEDAANNGPFDRMKISQGDLRWPTDFIHFRDLPSGDLPGKTDVLWASGNHSQGWEVSYGGKSQWQPLATSSLTKNDLMLGDF